jgi:hypothetical protein
VHGKNKEKEGKLKPESVCCAHCRGASIVILNWKRPLWEGDWEVVKGSDRGESMWVAIFMCMKAMLGISLYSYLNLKLAKMLHLSYYPLCFLFNKIRDQEGGVGSAWKSGWRGGGPNKVYTCELM